MPRAKARVVFEFEHDAGDHFASYEKPEVLIGDLRKMFSRTGPALASFRDALGIDIDR